METAFILRMNARKSQSVFGGALLGICLVLGTACGPSLPIRVPSFPSGAKGDNLRQVMGVRQNVGVIAVPPKRRFSKRHRYETWARTVETAVRQKFNEFGYYNIIDIETRRAQLSELARSQSGVTENQLEIGRQLSADGLLLISMTQEPNYGPCVAMRDQHQNLFGHSQEVTVYVTARLVNTETGKSLTHTNVKPHKHEYDASGCHNRASALEEAIDTAATNVASALSPRVLTHRINLSDDPGDLGDEAEQKRIRAVLRSGVDWARNGNFEEAEREWKTALRSSGGRAPGAYWNLAILAWRRGDMSGAENYFRGYLKLRPPDSSTRKQYSRFRSHQQLLRERSMGR